MKKAILFTFLLLLSISLLGCNQQLQRNNQVQQEGKSDEQTVRDLVDNFGTKLQMVSLQEPKDTLIKSMQENYGDFATPEIIKKWQNDPLNAPGRLVSSPWPDRIDIQTVRKLSEDAYEVKGEIIEVSSAEKPDDGAAAKRPVTLTVKKINNNWLIDDVILEPYEKADSIVYTNKEYGFDFSLPDSWKGYTIVNDKWEGLALDGSNKTVETDPKISIRHPEWTSEQQRQDIPIMIFTLNQWNSLQNDQFHIGAAPVNPSEIGRNSGYVFAIPARYNFAFLTGYEEVEDIIKNNPLKPTED